MVVEFSVKNFRSIRDLQTISFVATGLKSPKSEDCAHVDENNIDTDGGMRIMKTIGIYGANGSGKSNIIKALEFFLQIIKNEASSESNLNFLCDPFLFQDNALEIESYFQIILIIEGKKYRYGFTVKKNPAYVPSPKDRPEKISKEIVVDEWLFGTKGNNMGKYFTRKGRVIEKESILNNEIIPQIPYEHTLFLTHAAAFDGGGVCAVVRTFVIGWTISNFDGLESFRFSSISLLNSARSKSSFLNLLSSFNLKYDDIGIENDAEKNTIFIPQDKIYFTKSFKDKNNNDRKITLNLSHHESSGTQKLFDIAGLLLVAFSLDTNVFVILDEVDSNFHPSLLIKLIGLFNDPNINKNKSQLLFTSHDTNLMHPTIMRRDQFYFTEKREDLSTRVYSLADLRGIKNDADFAREYLKGIYGAIPILEDYSDNNLD